MLERIVVKAVLQLLKVSSSFPTFLVTQLAEHGFKKLIIPLIDLLVRRGQLVYDTKKGKIIARNIEEARANNDLDAYNRNSDDVFQ